MAREAPTASSEERIAVLEQQNRELAGRLAGYETTIGRMFSLLETLVGDQEDLRGLVVGPRPIDTGGEVEEAAEEEPAEEETDYDRLLRESE